jgi:hypothetical protein
MAFDFNFGSVFPSNPLAGIRPFQAGDLPFRAQALQGIQPISSVPSDYYSSIYNAALKPAEARLGILQQQGQQQSASVGEIFKGLQGFINSQTARQDEANNLAIKQAEEDKKAAIQAPLKDLEYQKAQLQMQETQEKIKNEKDKRMAGVFDRNWEKPSTDSSLPPPSSENSTQGMDTTSPAPDAGTNPYSPGGAADRAPEPMKYDTTSPDWSGDPMTWPDSKSGYLYKNAPNVPEYLRNTTPPKQGAIDTQQPDQSVANLPLTDIFSSLKASLNPTYGIPEASTPMQDLSKVANLPISNLAPYVSADSSKGAGSTPSLPVSQLAQTPSAEDFATYNTQAMGANQPQSSALSLQAMSAPFTPKSDEQSLASSEPAMPSYNEMQKIIASTPYPQTTFRSVGELEEYLKTQSANPRYKISSYRAYPERGVVSAQWEDVGDQRLKNFLSQQEYLQKEAERKSTTAQKEEDAQRRISEKEKRDQDAVVYQAYKSFQNDKRVASYLDKSSARSMLPNFISAYMNASKFPKVAGQADVSMMNLFGRAEGGGKITANEMHNLDNAQSPEGKFVTMVNHFGGGDMTYQEVRDQMLRELLETANIGADDVNKVVAANQGVLEGSQIAKNRARFEPFLGGHGPDKAFILKKDVVGDPEAKPGIINQILTAIGLRKPVSHKGIIADNIDKMGVIEQEIQVAKQKKDNDKVEYLQSEYDALKNENKIWRERLKQESMVDSPILGAMKQRDPKVLEGFVGSAPIPQNIMFSTPVGNGE